MGVYMKLVSIPNHPCSKKMKHNTPERIKNTNNIEDLTISKIKATKTQRLA
jgi:hypothetical protein